MKKILLLLLSLTIVFAFASCDNDKPTDPIIEEEVAPTLKKFTFVETTNEGELKLVVEINGDKGTIYYIIIKDGAAPTAEQVVAGVNYGSVTLVKNGNSGTSQTLDVTIPDLEKDVEYTAYVILKGVEKMSALQTKKATTFKEVHLGNGTEEDPFLIYTILDLETVGNGNHPNASAETPSWNKQSYYKLMNDIDLSEKYGDGKLSWVPLEINSATTGTGEDAVTVSGVFDGNGHTISNLYINDPTIEGDLGLFKMINTGATVKNLTLDGVYITGAAFIEQPKKVATTTGEGATAAGSYIGGLAGSMKGSAYNCHIKNAVIESTGSRVGGMFGRLYGDAGTAIVVKGCSAIDVDVTANGRVGGIVGLVDGKNGSNFTQTLIEDVLFVGTVTAVEILCQLGDANAIILDFEGAATHVLNSEYAGGIAGYFRGAKMTNIVVNATVSAVQHSGGVVGFQQRINAADSTLTSVENTLFKGSVVATDSTAGTGKTQLNFTVGNKSTGNGGTAETVFALNNFVVAGSTVISAPHANSVAGTEVATANLVATWLETNLPLFTFDISLLLE